MHGKLALSFVCRLHWPGLFYDSETASNVNDNIRSSPGSPLKIQWQRCIDTAVIVALLV